MSIAAVAVEKKTVTYFATALIFIAGIASFFSLGQLEDPEFTIKTAVIATSYPGASPTEVELEVTDRIETKIQELKQINWIESYSRAGYSQVKVEIKPTYKSTELPQIWDELRRKIREEETTLPPGANRPRVIDDFGDVFGFQLALMSDGFSYAEMEQYAKDLKKELSLVDGVARVELWGVQQKVVYFNVRESQLTQLGLSDESIAATLEQQNVVVDAGSLDLQNKRFRIAPHGVLPVAGGHCRFDDPSVGAGCGAGGHDCWRGVGAGGTDPPSGHRVHRVGLSGAARQHHAPRWPASHRHLHYQRAGRQHRRRWPQHRSAARGDHRGSACRNRNPARPLAIGRCG